MGNVTLPTPVFLAGGVLCLLGGYLVGVVAGPDTPARTTGTVVSFDSGRNRLCLTGDGVKDQAGADADGRLCGTWRRTSGAAAPRAGDRFRFVSVDATSDGSTGTVIYGDVVR